KNIVPMEMSKKAWNLLLPDEKMALTLSVINEKSTWEAGELMNKSHYKYLEILQRAKTFLAIFQRHFKLFDELIPSYVYGNSEVKEYFRLVIEKRLTPSK